MMNTPEFFSTRELREEIENASFKVRLRGYAPAEVDAFLDEVTESLKGLDGKLEEVRRYEAWLRVDVHAQVVDRAQQEAQQIMQEAQNKSRAMIDAARLDIVREQEELRKAITQYTQSWNEQKESLEQELSELRGYVRAYRNQATRAFEDALSAIRHDQKKDEDTAAARATLPPISSGSRLDTLEDIEHLLEELKRRADK